MSQRRILITGATGGLGMALIREARSRGHRVLATGRSVAAAEQIERLGAQFFPLDLADPRADIRSLVNDCESVIHAAALSASWGPAQAFETMNIAVTRRLLDAANAEGAARFVFVSSPSIFASFCDQIRIYEQAAPSPEPLNHYARTKLAAEKMVLAAHNDGFGGLACCAIRPRALVGSGDRVILPKLAGLAQRKNMPLPRGGRALIELTDLRDAAWAVCEAEERAPQLNGKAINVSGGVPVTVRKVACNLAEALGENPSLISLPVGIARPLANILEMLARLRKAEHEPVLTRYTLATLAYSQTFDLEPAQRLLSYEPQYDALATLLGEARKFAVGRNAP